MSITYEGVVAAHGRILPHIYRSPCVHSETLSRLCGAEVWSKLDHLQATGSFKERGACNALLQLPRDQRLRGVIAVSAGNHALGLARHGAKLGIPVSVVMPRFAPLIKVNNCRILGAEVILHGDDFATATEYGKQLSAEQGRPFIPAFDDPHIICGQGTVALEMLADAPPLDAMFIPVGGGGLIAGMARVIKHLQPHCQVIGVEPEHAAGMSAALAAGHPVRVNTLPTLADGLAVAQVGQHGFDCCRDLIDDVVTVSESQLAQAIVRLLEHEKTVLEGAGAASLAGALLPDYLGQRQLLGRRIGLVLCGGNIDLSVLNRVIERGFAADGRLCRITCTLRDRPGTLVNLCQIIADHGGNVKEISHDRTFGLLDPAWVTSVVCIETRDHDHIDEIRQALTAAGIRLSAVP